jgi:hypothetical protein
VETVLQLAAATVGESQIAANSNVAFKPTNIPELKRVGTWARGRKGRNQPLKPNIEGLRV